MLLLLWFQCTPLCLTDGWLDRYVESKVTLGGFCWYYKHWKVDWELNWSTSNELMFYHVKTPCRCLKTGQLEHHFYISYLFFPHSERLSLWHQISFSVFMWSSFFLGLNIMFYFWENIWHIQCSIVKCWLCLILNGLGLMHAGPKKKKRKKKKAFLYDCRDLPCHLTLKPHGRQLQPGQVRHCSRFVWLHRLGLMTLLHWWWLKA